MNNKEVLGTLLAVLIGAPACAVDTQTGENVGTSSQALEHDLDVISTTEDGSLTCYRDEVRDDTYTRICIWCERADGNINGQIFCRNEEPPAPSPAPEPGDYDDCDYYGDCDDYGDYGDYGDNPCAGIGNEYELAKCMGY